MNESVEIYWDRPENFAEGQTTVDGYIWHKIGDAYLKMPLNGGKGWER